MVSSGLVLVVIVVGGFVAAIGNVGLTLVKDVDNKKRGALLILIAFFGFVAAVATSVYPSAREREAKERLAHDAKVLLLPEIQQNEANVANMLKILSDAVPIGGLEVAAWQTITTGGLLSGLKAEEASRFLRVYSLIFQVNNMKDQLLDLEIGIRSALSNRGQIRALYSNSLQAKLTALQQAFSELDENPQRKVAERPTRHPIERPWHF